MSTYNETFMMMFAMTIGMAIVVYILKNYEKDR
jgi:hypothetical protein